MTKTLVAALALALGGCDEETTRAGDGGAGTGATGGGGAGGGAGGEAGEGGVGGMCAGACAPAAASGWQGPVAIASGAACPAGYTMTAERHGYLTVGPSTCGCACTTEAVECEPATFYLFESSCSDILPETYSLPAGECVSADVAIDEGLQAHEPGSLGDPQVWGDCTEVPTEQHPFASWGQNDLICAPADVSACAEGTCIPDADGSDVCIYAEGDVACPAGPYLARQVLYSGFDDDRDCSECTCGAPTGTCTGTIQLMTGGCSTLVNTVMENVSCYDSPFTATEVRWQAGILANCAPVSPSTLTGAVTPQEPVTYCCLE